MKFKITANKRNYIVTAKDAKTALEALSEFEDGVSPMTYKKLKEQGYTREDWKDWSDEEKFEKSQTEETNKTVEKLDKPQQPNNPQVTQKPDVSHSVENTKRIADKYKQFAGSPDVQALVKKIDAKQYMPIEELRKHPAIQQMDKLIEDYNASISDRLESGVVIPLEEQEEIKQTLLKRGSVSGVDAKGDAIYDGPLKQERKAVIVIGLPSSGKSSKIVNTVSGPMRAFVVDSDEAKFLSKEFQATNGVAGDAIHRDSQKIIRQVFEQQLVEGTNMIIPVIGSSESGLYNKWINALERAGYDVEIQLHPASPTESVNRTVSRAITKNRPIKSSVIFEYGDKPREVFKSFEGKLNAQGKPYTNRKQNNI